MQEVYWAKRMRDRKATDLNFKLRTILRKRIWGATKRMQKAGSAINDLGCTIEEFKAYVESKWASGMSWDNHGQRGWHLDHITPLASFDLSEPMQFKQAAHYTNYQPLWWLDNIRKSAAIS